MRHNLLLAGLLLSSLLVSGCSDGSLPQVPPGPDPNAGISGMVLIQSSQSGEPGDMETTEIHCSVEPGFCHELLDSGILEPLPADTACTMVYGGPGTVSLSGAIAKEGETIKVSAELNLSNGCEIGRMQSFADAAKLLEMKTVTVPNLEV